MQAGSGREVLAEQPELQGLRRFPVPGGFEKFFVFCRPLPDGVGLLRVLQGSHDLDALLREGFSGL